MEPENISNRAMEAYLSADETFASPASFWEIAVKVSVGKLTLKKGWSQRFHSMLQEEGIQMIPFQVEDYEILSALPLHNKDPFDRMLIAQAKSRSLALVSNDSLMENYGIPVIW